MVYFSFLFPFDISMGILYTLQEFIHAKILSIFVSITLTVYVDWE